MQEKRYGMMECGPGKGSFLMAIWQRSEFLSLLKSISRAFPRGTFVCSAKLALGLQFGHPEAFLSPGKQAGLVWFLTGIQALFCNR